MKVLVLGHRLGLAKALEKMGIPYSLWTTKPVKNSLKAEQIIISHYPQSLIELKNHNIAYKQITHVIAGVESSVFYASIIRKLLNIQINSHDVIISCTDKLEMKKRLEGFQIPMTRFSSHENKTFDELVSQLGCPFLCKPRMDSGGRGIRRVQNQSDFDKLGHHDYYYEKLIDGREGSIESFICNEKIKFSNMTEYYKLGACNKLPALYDDHIANEIRSLNEKVISLLKIKRGLTHLEYYITKDGVLFGEIALRPPGGYLMEILSLAYNQSFWELYARVELGEEIEEVESHSYASSVIIHPGAGEVQEIEGVDKLPEIESLRKFKLKLEPGDEVVKRTGVGEDYGYALFENEERDQLNLDVDQFYNLLKIRMIESN